MWKFEIYRFCVVFYFLYIGCACLKLKELYIDSCQDKFAGGPKDPQHVLLYNIIQYDII